MLAEQAWIAVNVDPAERVRVVGSFSAFRGLVAVPAPILGGWLFDLYGFDVPIAVNLVLAVVDGLLILLLVKDRARAPAASV